MMPAWGEPRIAPVAEGGFEGAIGRVIALCVQAVEADSRARPTALNAFGPVLGVAAVEGVSA